MTPHAGLYHRVAGLVLRVICGVDQADVFINLAQRVLYVAKLPVKVPGQTVAEGDQPALVHHNQGLVNAFGEPVVAAHHMGKGIGDLLIALFRKVEPLTDLPLLVDPLLTDKNADHPVSVLNGLHRLDGSRILLGDGLHLLGGHPEPKRPGHGGLILLLGQEPHHSFLVRRGNIGGFCLRHHNGVPVFGGTINKNIRVFQVGQGLEHGAHPLYDRDFLIREVRILFTQLLDDIHPVTPPTSGG